MIDATVKSRIPPEFKIDDLADVINRVATPRRTDPVLWLAVAWVETGWRWAAGYNPKGANAGWGDAAPRSLSQFSAHLAIAGYSMNDLQKKGSRYIFKKPMGFGHGPWQLDLASHSKFIGTGGWKDLEKNFVYVLDYSYRPDRIRLVNSVPFLAVPPEFRDRNKTGNPDDDARRDEDRIKDYYTNHASLEQQTNMRFCLLTAHNAGAGGVIKGINRKIPVDKLDSKNGVTFHPGYTHFILDMYEYLRTGTPNAQSNGMFALAERIRKGEVR